MKLDEIFDKAQELAEQNGFDRVDLVKDDFISDYGKGYLFKIISFNENSLSDDDGLEQFIFIDPTTGFLTIIRTLIN